ncbi:MAG: M3 family oligoendopeptidase [Chloroflexi bacterium]|nr:M3 family oligoendopeptidase [Chloroflexota bacterium]
MPAQATNSLPHWDMTVVYPSLESPEFENGFHAAIKKVDDLVALFDQEKIARRDALPLDDAAIAAFERVVAAMNQTLDETRTLGAFISSFVSTDSRNNLAQGKLSEFQQHMLKLQLLGTRFTAWIGSLDVDALIARSKIAHAHAFMVRRAKIQAAHQMSPPEEELATELSITGSTAWGKLHGNFTSQLMLAVDLPDGKKEMPMSMLRNLAYDPNRDVRRRAYEAEVAAWKNAAVPLAAAMNSIKGATNTLSRKRKWDSALDAALFQNHIDRAALDAMMTAAREAFPDFRRYLRAKARALGVAQCAWYDIFAPLGGDGRVWSYADGSKFVIEQFHAYSSKMGNMAERAFKENWIDAEPRNGKRDGAFCMSLRADESRVLANFKPNFSSVGTLAHELGHAYHNVNLTPRTMLQRSTPMTLAETASIFCQRWVEHAALEHADAREQIAILETGLQDACQVVVDITSRFIFEQTVFEKRAKRELSADEFSEIMLDAQKQTYGDGLDPNALHAYMWAMKPHYYGSTFYNYPYMFGLLFGVGMYARAQSDLNKFKTEYDDLLSSTGMYDAAELAARFGIDIRQPDFWRASLDVIRADINRFEKLVDKK